MNELYEKYNGKGLHMLGLYAQGQPLEAVRKVVTDKAIKYPQIIAWLDEEKRWDASTLPRVYVIGVDGKIKFSGSKGYETILEEELAKVKHPGLGELKVPPELEESAKAFAAMDYTKAWQLADAAGNKAEAADAVVEAASAIKDKVDERLRLLRNKAEVAEVENDWPLVVATWGAIAKRFAGYEDAADAKEKVEKLKADKKVRLELEAATAIRVIDRELNEKSAALDEWIKRYKEFDAKYKETGWHEKAAGAIERMEEELKEAEEAKKKEGK
jgi:hypothetical protein